MKTKILIQLPAGTVFLILFNFHIVWSADHTESILDDVRPEENYYTYGTGIYSRENRILRRQRQLH